MTKIDHDAGFARDFDQLHDVDHAALITLGTKLMKPVLEEKCDPKRRRLLEKAAITKMKAQSYAYRCLLDCIYKHDPAILLGADVASRYTAQTAAWMIETHQKRLGLRSMGKVLSDLVRFARVCAPKADISFLHSQAKEFNRRAKRAEKNKKNYAIAPAELPIQFWSPHDSLATSDAYQGEFLRLLGAQKRAGVDIQTLDVAGLATPEAIANFENAVPASEGLGQRISALGCMMQTAAPGFAQAFFDRASELRKSVANPANIGLFERRACAFEELPEEAKARFTFVTTYDGELSFIFEEREVFLPKARRRRDSREYSETSIAAMRDALRHHCTILRANNSPLAEDVERWGEPEAIAQYQQFYAESDFITQTSCLEALIAALRSIYGDAQRQLFLHERRQIKLIRAFRTLMCDEDTGFDLRSAGQIDGEADDDAADPPSTEELSAASIAIATRALKRLRELQKSPLPYRDLGRLAAFFRTALIVAFLAECATRLRSTASLDKGHLKKPQPTRFGDTNAKPLTYVVTLPGVLMKNGQPFTHTMTPGLSKLFDDWFDEVRPMLLAGHTDVDAVFVSDRGERLSRSAYQRSLPLFTAFFFNFRIHPHLFRKLVGTELVGNRKATQRRLQHKLRESQEPYQDKIKLRDQDRSTSLRQQTAGFFNFAS